MLGRLGRWFHKKPGITETGNVEMISLKVCFGERFFGGYGSFREGNSLQLHVFFSSLRLIMPWACRRKFLLKYEWLESDPIWCPVLYEGYLFVVSYDAIYCI